LEETLKETKATLVFKKFGFRSTGRGNKCSAFHDYKKHNSEEFSAVQISTTKVSFYAILMNTYRYRYYLTTIAIDKFSVFSLVPCTRSTVSARTEPENME
jgi:hypothetical protein